MNQTILRSKVLIQFPSRYMAFRLKFQENCSPYRFSHKSPVEHWESEKPLPNRTPNRHLFQVDFLRIPNLQSYENDFARSSGFSCVWSGWIFREWIQPASFSGPCCSSSFSTKLWAPRNTLVGKLGMHFPEEKKARAGAKRRIVEWRYKYSRYVEPKWHLYWKGPGLLKGERAPTGSRDMYINTDIIYTHITFVDRVLESPFFFGGVHNIRPLFSIGTTTQSCTFLLHPVFQPQHWPNMHWKIHDDTV